MTKKKIWLWFGFLLLPVLVSTPASAKPVQVFACEPEWKALAEEVGGKHVYADSATTAFQDPHHIEARPSLIAKARRADIIFCTGADLEIGWLPLLIRQSGNKAIQANQSGHFLAAEQVLRIEVPQNLDRSEGDIHAGGNPHVHLDPQRLLTIAEKFSQRLVEIDPAHEADYQSYLADFKQRWHLSVVNWEKTAEMLRGKTAIVYHKNWSYLLDWLHISVIGDLEPKPGIPPTSAHLGQLLKIAREQTPDYILIASYQDDRGAKWLAKKSGIPLVKLPFTVGGNDQVNDLFALYANTLSLLGVTVPSHSAVNSQ